jgi:hypothetical protein
MVGRSEILILLAYLPGIIICLGTLIIILTLWYVYHNR